MKLFFSYNFGMICFITYMNINFNLIYLNDISIIYIGSSGYKVCIAQYILVIVTLKISNV